MAEPVDAVAAAAEALAAAVEGDFNDSATSASDAAENGSALKKRALEMLTAAADEANDGAAAGDDLELGATTLDDVMVSPVLKKPRVEEAENDEDEPLTGGEADEEDVDLDDLVDDDADALAPPDASTDEDEESPARGNGNGKTLDVVTLDDEDDDLEEEEDDDDEVKVDNEEDDEGDEEDDDEDDEEEGQLLSPMQRRKIAQNKTEARQLLHQLDSSARSKLVLTALEKYGEDLFDGHEAARDGILVDACANDAMLGLLKDAIRVSELSLRGTEDAPLEVDDDEDYGDEDEDDDDETDDGGKRAVNADDEDDEDEEDDGTPGEINLLSDEETDDNSSAHAMSGVINGDDEDEEDEDDEDDDTAGTGGELTVESATGDEDSLDELSS